MRCKYAYHERHTSKYSTFSTVGSCASGDDAVSKSADRESHVDCNVITSRLNQVAQKSYEILSNIESKLGHLSGVEKMTRSP